MSLTGRAVGRWPARALLVVTSLALSILFLEAACRVYVLVFRAEAPPTDSELAGEPPLPYAHADYLSPRFFQEQLRAFTHVPAASGPHMLLNDVAGQYFNVVKGLRLTTNQPPHPARRILVFGGSTVLSQEVPDQHTIPSYLQRMINATCATPIAVFNYGVSSMDAAQQRARLLEAGLLPSDIVVFYDGVNEIYYTIYTGERASDGQDPWVDRVWMAVDRASRVSAVASMITGIRQRTVPKTMSDASLLRDNLNRLQEKYRHELVETSRFVSAARGRFLHFLQPHLFATRASTAYRQALTRRYLPQDFLTRFRPRHPEPPPGWSLLTEAPALDLAFQLGYPRLREAMTQAAGDGVESFDLSGLLDDERVPAEVFLDFAHVNHVANEVSAKAMFTRIAPRIGTCAVTG